MRPPPLDLPLNVPDPGVPLGRVVLPGSKSATNRALVLAAQAPGVSHLEGGLEAEDTQVMRQALRGLGCDLEERGPVWSLRGGGRPRSEAPLWLGASGTSLRFLLPWLALQASMPVAITGEARLFERPLAPLVEALAPLGVRWEAMAAGGRLHPAGTPPSRIDVAVQAGASSQFLTGLALAAAGLPDGGRLRWAGEPASPSYLRLTEEALLRFGCESWRGVDHWEIPGGRLRPADWALPADWSGAAAFLCAAALTGRPLRLEGLDPDDSQGDRILVDLLAAAGCRCVWDGPVLEVSGALQRGIEADLRACPDLAPVLAATAALAPGPSRLAGLETLPLKECDRLEACVDLVQWLGGQAMVDGARVLRILPGPSPDPDRPPFDPRRDHRMAFAAAVGALRHGGRLADPGCVAKTFPDFWEAWTRLLAGLAR